VPLDASSSDAASETARQTFEQGAIAETLPTVEIPRAELEAGVIDARKFHRVADAEGIVQIVVIERVGGKVVAQTLACF